MIRHRPFWAGAVPTVSKKKPSRRAIGDMILRVEEVRESSRNFPMYVSDWSHLFSFQRYRSITAHNGMIFACVSEFYSYFTLFTRRILKISGRQHKSNISHTVHRSSVWPLQEKDLLLVGSNWPMFTRFFRFSCPMRPQPGHVLPLSLPFKKCTICSKFDAKPSTRSPAFCASTQRLIYSPAVLSRIATPCLRISGGSPEHAARGGDVTALMATLYRNERKHGLY